MTPLPSEETNRANLALVHAVDPERRIIIRTDKLESPERVRIVERLFEFNAKVADILLTLDSSGGSYKDGQFIHDCIRNSKSRVIGLVEGRANSAIFTVLQGCHIRLATENSTLIVHNPEIIPGRKRVKHNSSLRDAKKDFLELRSQVQKERRWFINFALKCSKGGISRIELVELLEKESELSASEALTFGWLDGIV
jgi:ATP-dependent protease ClpP protease subunit